jgi:hypothetical protein
MTEEQAMTLITWLKKWRATQAAGALFFCSLSLVSGAVILFLTFWFAYAIIFVSVEGASAASQLIFNHALMMPHGWRLVCAGVFIVLVIIESARTPNEELTDYPRESYPFGARLAWMSGIVSLLMMLKYRRASSQIIRQCLFVGPRLEAASWRYWVRFLRLLRLQSDSCAAALACLAAGEESMTLTELAGKLPVQAGRDLAANLGLIEGVVLVGHEVTRFALTDDFRTELSLQAP